MDAFTFTPQFEYFDFSDNCRKYDDIKDRIVLRPTEKKDVPPPSFIATYTDFTRSKLSFTIMGNPHWSNAMRVLWEVHVGETFLAHGNENALVGAHNIKVKIPSVGINRSCREIKLSVSLQHNKVEEDTTHCGVIISGLKNENNSSVFWFNMDTLSKAKPPVPPYALMEWGESGEKHLELGIREFQIICKTLTRNGFDFADMGSILEFGCSNCRILRHFMDLQYPLSIWGTDLQANKVLWAMENLPELNLIVNNVSPPLPFISGFFDFIYAGSVFSHLVDYHTAWIVELARVTKPGGCAYLTFQDEICAKHITNALIGKPSRLLSYAYTNFFLQDEDAFDRLNRFDFDFLSGGGYMTDKAQAHVFMSKRYIEKITGAFFELVDIIPDAYGDYQTAYLFRRK